MTYYDRTLAQTRKPSIEALPKKQSINMINRLLAISNQNQRNLILLKLIKSNNLNNDVIKGLKLNSNEKAFLKEITKGGEKQKLFNRFPQFKEIINEL